MGLAKRKTSNDRAGGRRAQQAAKPRSLSDRIAGNPARKTMLIAAVATFILTRVWWLFFFGGLETGGTGYFAFYAQKGVDAGEVAYRDFKLEYPPVAWWLMEMPRLIDPHKYTGPRVELAALHQYRKWYYGWFHAALFLSDAACFCLLFAVGRRVSAAAEFVLPAAYTMITVAQPHFMYDSLDLVLLLFFLLCIYCWLRSLESSAATLWACASYLFLGLGISYKIVPLIFVPFLLLADLRAFVSPWRLAGRVGALATAAAGPFLVHFRSAGWGVFKLFQYHSERGINLESTWGSLLLAAALLGFPYEVIDSHVSYDLVGPGSGALNTLAHVAPVLAAGLLGLWALARGSRFDRRLAVDTAILALVTTTVLSHVYSCYYTNWLLPLATLLALSIFPPSWLRWSLFAAASAVILLVSNWIWPAHYATGLAKLHDLPVELCILRSACLVGLALLLTVSFFGKYRLLAPQKA